MKYGHSLPALNPFHDLNPRRAYVVLVNILISPSITYLRLTPHAANNDKYRTKPPSVLSRVSVAHWSTQHQGTL